MGFANSNVREIGSLAFQHCTALASVEFANSIVSSIGSSAFDGCTALASVGFANSNVREIGSLAFGNTAVERLEFADSTVDSIGSSAFSGCAALASVEFANTIIRSIGSQSFMDCTALVRVGFANSYVRTIGESVFTGCTALVRAEFANSKVTSIGVYAFEGCTALAGVGFANSIVSSIGRQSFAKCTALASVGFANSKVTSIGNSAFAECSNLSSLDLSSAPVSLIDELAFQDCTSLKTITIPERNISIDPSAFSHIGCNSLRLAVGPGTCLRECATCPMRIVSVGPRSDAPPANQTGGQPSCGGDTSDRIAYAYQSSRTTFPPANQAAPRPWVTIVRQKWAIGRTYQFPPINTTVTDANASRVRYRLETQVDAQHDTLPPGFFINPLDGSMLGVPPAEQVGRQFNATLSVYDVDGNLGEVVLSNFSLQFEYADVDDRSSAVGPHDKQCRNGAARVEQQLDANWSAEFDGHYGCNCTLGFAGDNCEDKVADPPLTVISITPGAALDNAVNYSVPAVTEHTPRLSVGRSLWAVGETYRLPAIAVQGCSNASTVPVNCTEAVAAGYRGNYTFDLVPLPPGWFINTGTGSILGQYTGNIGTVHESSIMVSRPGTRPTVIGAIRFQFAYRDTDPRSTAVGPHEQPCQHGGTRAENQLGANWSADFDGHYFCDCTQGFAGDNCETAALGPIPEPSRLPTIIIISIIGAMVLAAGSLYYVKRTMPRLKVQAARRRLRAIANGTARCVPDGDEAQQLLFTALSIGCDDLVAALLEHGADAKARHPTTHQLPHSLALGREPPNTGLITELFRAHCEVDANIGELLRQPAKQALLEHTLLALAREQWRSPVDGSTVLHKVVDGCRLGQLEASVATALAARLLRLEPLLLLVADRRSRSPAALAVGCDNARELERLLSTVVFDRYQLLHVETHEYRSPTAVIHRCRDLDDPAAVAGDDAPALVIKMMKDKQSWARELQSRSALTGSGAEAAVVSVASATGVCDARTFRELDLPASVARLTRRCPDTVVKNARHQVAFELMSEYPFALCMPMAERNLLEIIQSERLAGLPIGLIGFTARKIAVAIDQLHGAGVVHADIKPRNIVRTPGDVFKLIDFDMAFLVDGQTGGLPSVHAAASKIKASNAYATPELVRWSNDGARATVSDGGAIRGLVHPVQVDLFSFGLTLFELVTGAPLLEHSYDSLTPRSLPTMLNWSASTPAFDEDAQKQIGALHPGQDAIALVNVLQWLLDDDASKRPQSMAEVLAHSFFDSTQGVMREHFLVQKIRKGLADPRQHRDCPRVMISYCWADTNFVLGKLVMALAGRVKSLWLDRLGGSDGMGDWARQSMDRGVAGADVVLAVVSPKFAQSKNCGFEMALCARHSKPVIPLVYGLAFEDWSALKKIGETELTTQFHDAATGDAKLFVDFGVPGLFETKFHQELVPRLQAVPGAAAAAAGPADHRLPRRAASPAPARSGSGSSRAVINPAFSHPDQGTYEDSAALIKFD